MKHLELNPDQTDSIIFLHGGNVAGWMWGAQVPAFGDFHLLIPDYPGFGESNDEDWVSIADTADQVANLIAEHAHSGRAHIVGLSLGSGVAIELALRHPERVTSLFLSSTLVTRVGPLTSVMTRLMLTQWNREGFWRTLARSYGLPEDSVELFVSTGLGIKAAAARAIYAEVITPIAPERLASIGAPALAVAGERDTPAIRRDSLKVLADSGMRTAIAPGMHHQWNIENVELFNNAVRDWITGAQVAAGLSARI